MKQKVYIPKEYFSKNKLKVGTIDEDDYYKSFNSIESVDEKEGFFFTEEQLKQLLSDYTNEVIENAEIKNTGFIGEDGWVDSQEIDKESITNQLDLFIKTII